MGASSNTPPPNTPSEDRSSKSLITSLCQCWIPPVSQTHTHKQTNTHTLTQGKGLMAASSRYVSRPTEQRLGVFGEGAWTIRAVFYFNTSKLVVSPSQMASRAADHRSAPRYEEVERQYASLPRYGSVSFPQKAHVSLQAVALLLSFPFLSWSR